MSSNPLKPGMIGVKVKSGSGNALDTIDTVLQGDTTASHVWWVLPNGKIATTGAKAFVFYGEVDAQEYIQNQSFFLLEPVTPLTSDQLGKMQQAHEDIMKSGLFRAYGFWKFFLLEAIHIFSSKPVSKTGFKPKTGTPQFPICSQAVAYCLWSAGIQIGKMFGKVDYTAVLPETFLAEAQAVTSIMNAGDFQAKPDCEFLKVVDFINNQ